MLQWRLRWLIINNLKYLIQCIANERQFLFVLLWRCIKILEWFLLIWFFPKDRMYMTCAKSLRQSSLYMVAFTKVDWCYCINQALFCIAFKYLHFLSIWKCFKYHRRFCNVNVILSKQSSLSICVSIYSQLYHFNTEQEGMSDAYRQHQWYIEFVRKQSVTYSVRSQALNILSSIH